MDVDELINDKLLITGALEGNNKYFKWDMSLEDLHDVRVNIWLIRKLLNMFACEKTSVADLDSIYVIFRSLMTLHSTAIKYSQFVEARLVYLSMIAWKNHYELLMQMQTMDESFYIDLLSNIGFYAEFWKEYEVANVTVSYFDITFGLCSTVPYVVENDDKRFNTNDIAALLGFLITGASWHKCRYSRKGISGVRKSIYINSLIIDQVPSDIMDLCKRLNIFVSYPNGKKHTSVMLTQHPIIDIVHKSILNKGKAKNHTENDYKFPAFVWRFTPEQARLMLTNMFRLSTTVTRKTKGEVIKLSLLAEMKLRVGKIKNDGLCDVFMC